MIKTILVLATGNTSDTPVFNTAATVARVLNGHLDFLHVRIDPAEIVAAFATDPSGGMVSAHIIDQLEAEAVERGERARKAVQEFCQREGVALDAPDGRDQIFAAQWHREIGREPDWVAEYGRTSDLVVIGRSEQTDRRTLEAALLDTGRPLLIPGAIARPMDTVAIAWKSTREAGHALTAAWPFIAKAKEVVVLTAPEGGRSDEGETRLLQTLRRHNSRTDVRRLDPGHGSVADTLLTAATELGAGLLVMGGYSHSRLRELVFGGVTERVLRGADLPVLMAH